MSTEKIITTCPLDCFDVCSLTITVEDGKAVKIEGNKEHPVTKGYICDKGRKHLERVYSPKRLKYPMKKQDGEWVRISWEEAFSIMSDKLNSYIAEYGGQSIASYSYGGAAGQLKNVEEVFFEQLGCTTFVGSLCMGAGAAAQKKDFGDVISHAHVDMLNSRTIVIWGRNPAETNMHIMEYIKKAKDNGSRIILIDPIKTATAKHCDWHTQLKPNSDCAFALATAKYILEKNLCDTEFINARTSGYEQLAKCILGLDYGMLLDICGIEMNILIQFADAIACSVPASIHIGYGLQRNNFGGLTVRSIDMLGAITGSIGKAGGGVNYANRISSGIYDWNVVEAANTPKMRELSRPKFSREVKNASNPPIKAIFISRANPVLQVPDSNGVIEALQGIDFKVVLEHFMTDTAMLADLVLPVTYFMEENDLISSGMWNPYIYYNKKCIERFYEAKPEYEIYTELARRMNITGFPEYDDQQWIDTLMRSFGEKGIDINELKNRGYVLSPGFKQVPWAEGCFATQSGKFEFLEAENIEKYLLSKQSTLGYKFSLISVHSIKSLHSQHYIDSEESMPAVYIYPTDAAGHNINDGDEIKLFNNNGELRVKAIISSNCQKGMLYMHESWWLKNGGSVNMLTSAGASDIGEQAVFNECMCNICK